MLKIPAVDPHAPIALVNIGNTNTTVATWTEGQARTPLIAATGDMPGFDELMKAHLAALSKGKPAAVVICSVVPRVLQAIVDRTSEAFQLVPLVVGEAIPLPMDVGVQDRKAIGVDRVCAAAAAYEKLQHGCIVVDFGTAITVDLVDDDGVLVGGAILPGPRLQLRALHEHTGQLPLVPLEVPELPFGRNTAEAMQTGVVRGSAGAVRNLVESYAAHLNRWPQVVATGGDVTMMAPHCDFIDTMVNHLTISGVGLAWHKYLFEQGV